MDKLNGTSVVSINEKLRLGVRKMIILLLIIILFVLCFFLYKNLQKEKKTDEDIQRIQNIYQFSNSDSAQRCPECDGIYLREKGQCAVCGFNSKKENGW